MELRQGIDVKYIIDEKNRTVVAYTENTKRLAYYKLRDYLSAKHVDFNCFDIGLMDIPNRFVGKAVCHAEDVFDVEEGKRIAKRKLYKKFDTSVYKAYRRYLKKNMEKLLILSDIISEYYDEYVAEDKCM